MLWFKKAGRDKVQEPPKKVHPVIITLGTYVIKKVDNECYYLIEVIDVGFSKMYHYIGSSELISLSDLNSQIIGKEIIPFERAPDCPFKTEHNRFVEIKRYTAT